MFTRKITYEPGMDIYDIHLAHLSDKYFLWQVNFGDSPMIEDGVFTLCLDTDRNDDTGIKTEEASSPRRGTDLEVSIEQGKAIARNWNADGTDGGSQEIPWFKKNTVTLLRDLAAGRAGEGHGILRHGRRVPLADHARKASPRDARHDPQGSDPSLQAQSAR